MNNAEIYAPPAPGAARLCGPRQTTMCALVCASAINFAWSDQGQGQPPAPHTSPAVPRASDLHFTDITNDSGIHFTTTCGKLPATQILEVNGCGLGLFDYDHDGDLDLFVTNGATMDNASAGPGCRLYRNDGGAKFSDVTDQAGIAVKRWANGIAVGDVDGDGWEDLFIPCYGPDILLHNNGDGTFKDISSSAGVDKENSWGASAAFGDLDNDGDLDLYVANYLAFDVAQPPARVKFKGVEVMAGPHGLVAQRDFLYLNDGKGVFREATKECVAKPPQDSFGLNVVIVDFDSDGWQDIVVANDSQAGFLFHNLGVKESTPAFEEIGVISGIASNGDGVNQAAMGIGIADVDGNAFPDKFTTVFSSDTNTLHLNVNGKLFEDRSASYGLGMVSRPYLGWACGFFDFDLDVDEDLLMFNGHVYPEATMESMDSDYEQTPLLFAREGKKFRRVEANEAGAWLAEKHRDRSAVFGDIDNDGDIDVIVSELNGPIRVLQNDAISPSLEGGGKGVGEAYKWLQVELRDERAATKNHAALGARIEFVNGERTQRRWLFSGGGFQSSSPPIAHFGVPTDAKSLTLRIIWPDRFEQTIDNVKANQKLVVRRE